MDFPQNDYLSYCIADFLVSQNYAVDYTGNYYNTVEWLSMCSELEKVQITPSKYDEGLLYCGKAWDYSVSKSAISSQLTTALVQLLFAWGALESLIKATVPNKQIKKYGKINALCGYLKEHNLNGFLPDGYLYEYERMVTLLREIPSYKDILIDSGMEGQTKYSFKSYVDISGVGVYVVSKIRNNFVHGQMRFPEPEEYSGEPISNIELIHTATRITLMTMLIVLISDVKDHDFILENAPNDGMQYSALTYLKNLCSYHSEVFEGQMQLSDFVDLS